MSDTIIFHNPRCGTSRNTLALIRNAGIEPRIVAYLETPPTSDELARILSQAGITARQLLRAKEPLCAELGLDAPEVSEAQLIDAMVRHPVLINRPVVITPKGTALCRPSEKVLDILHQPQRGPFTKEDGEVVIDERGQRVR